jgi:multidrug resistance efflux pump
MPRPIWSRRSSTTSARSNSSPKDEVSAQERDLAATALKRAEAIFKAAQQRYNEAVEGSRKEDIAIARANLNEANANLGLSQVNLVTPFCALLAGV